LSLVNGATIFFVKGVIVEVLDIINYYLIKRKKEEGRRKREEGRGKKEEGRSSTGDFFTNNLGLL
jgi:hypothetical protein